MPEVVAGYADLLQADDLRPRDADIVARELEEHIDSGEWLVAWAPDWILEEKALVSAKPSRHVISPRIDHETEKAYLLKQGRDEAWVPKSVITVFDIAPGAEISVPQSDLDDYAAGAGAGGGRA